MDFIKENVTFPPSSLLRPQAPITCGKMNGGEVGTCAYMCVYERLYTPELIEETVF